MTLAFLGVVLKDLGSLIQLLSCRREPTDGITQRLSSLGWLDRKNGSVQQQLYRSFASQLTGPEGPYLGPS